MANVIKTHTLFPTLVSEFSHTASKSLLDTIQKEDLETKSPIPFHSRSSECNELQKKNEYKEIVDKILDVTKEVCKLYNYEYKSLEITNMWVNVSKKGDFHAPHSHSNNIFSGVWYPFQSEKPTPIRFKDPRQVMGILSPRGKVNEVTSNLRAVQNWKDMGLIFPSWLEHYVPPALCTRVSLSWNILLRGEYGNPNTLQNAYI